MWRSRPATFLAIALILLFAFSTVCFASPVWQFGYPASEMPSGCHGNHGPMPSPAHTCCFAAHQVAAATPIAPSSVAPDTFESDLVNVALFAKPGVSAPVP